MKKESVQKEMIDRPLSKSKKKGSNFRPLKIQHEERMGGGSASLIVNA